MHCLLIMMLSHSDTSSASFSRSLPKHIHFFRFEFWLWFKNYFGACRSSVRNVYTDAHRVIKVLCLCMHGSLNKMKYIFRIQILFLLQSLSTNYQNQHTTCYVQFHFVCFVRSASSNITFVRCRLPKNQCRYIQNCIKKMFSVWLPKCFNIIQISTLHNTFVTTELGVF